MGVGGGKFDLVIECIAYKSVNYGARCRQGGRGSIKIIICRYSNPCVSFTVMGKIKRMELPCIILYPSFWLFLYTLLFAMHLLDIRYI